MSMTHFMVNLWSFMAIHMIQLLLLKSYSLTNELSSTSQIKIAIASLYLFRGLENCTRTQLHNYHFTIHKDSTLLGEI